MPFCQLWKLKISERVPREDGKLACFLFITLYLFVKYYNILKLQVCVQSVALMQSHPVTLL